MAEGGYEASMKKTIRCSECNSAMTVTRENRRYGDGLDVVLTDIEVRRCRDCGEEEVVIPRMSTVLAAIATTLISQPARLTPAEIRFLRTYLGYSSADFAKKMGVSKETVSRWENGARNMTKTAEKLLRLMVVLRDNMGPYDLIEMGVDAARRQRMTLHQSSSGWSAAFVSS